MRGLSCRLILAGLCLAAAACSAVREVKKHPDYSGVWKLNEDLSQTLQQAMRPEGDGGSRGGWGGVGGGRGGGRGGGMGRRRGGGGFPGGPGSPGGPGGGRPEGGPRFDEEAAGGSVTIAETGPQLTLTYASGRSRVLFTDDRKVKEQRPDGQTVKTRAHWTDAGALEVVTKGGRGGKRTEIFELSNDGRRLFVIVGLEGRGPRPIQIRRVYDRAQANDKAAG